MEFAALQKEMITAMKAREKSKKDAISSIVAAVKKVAIDEGNIQAVADQRLPQRFHVDLIFIRAEAGSAASGEKNCRNSSAQISFSGCHITCRTRQRSD